MAAKRRNRKAHPATSSNRSSSAEPNNNSHHIIHQVHATPVLSAANSPIPVTINATPLYELNPKEAARKIKKQTVDPSTQIVRHFAIFRFLLFLVLVYVSSTA